MNLNDPNVALSLFLLGLIFIAYQISRWVIKN